MKAALFAVVSPLQYINALEARHAFGLDPAHCYLAVGESKKLPATGRQVRSLIDPSQWRTIQSVTGFPAPRGVNRLHGELLQLLGGREYAKSANQLIERARSECGGIEYVFIGDYRPLNFRHFIGAVPEARIFLLDDGSVTHQAVRFRKDRDSPHLYAKPFARPSWLTHVRSALSGLRFAEPEKLGFFTCYDFEPPRQDAVVTHDYAHFRHTYPKLEPSQEVWFLGANHIENNFTSKEKYFALLQRVREFYRSEKVVYLPHRGEDQAKLEEVARLGFEVSSFDLPIEIVIGQSRRFPQVLAGVASSAIDNLSVILRGRIQIHVFCVEDGYSPPEQWNHLKDVIDYHRRDVFGLSTFVHAGETGTFRGPVVDHKQPRALEADERTLEGAWYWAADGFMHGPSECAIEETLEARQLRVRPLRPMAHRDLRVGDRVLLRSLATGDAYRGRVIDLEFAARLVVEFDDRCPQADAPGWVFERPERRSDHSPGSGVPIGVLFEPRGVNLLEGPRRWNRPEWQLTGCAAFGAGSMADSRIVLDPEGGHSAAFIQLDRSTGPHALERQVYLPADPTSEELPLTWSVFARSGGCDEIELGLEHAASGKRVAARFCLLESEGGPADSHLRGDGRARRLDCSNGWVRCVVSAVFSPGEVRVRLSAVWGEGVGLDAAALDRASEERTATGDGCSGVYVFGPQLERAPMATSPILPFSEQFLPRGADKFDFVMSGEAAVGFIECALPDANAPVTLLRWNEGELVVHGSVGDLEIVSGSRSVAKAKMAPLRDGEPFVLALSKQGGTCEVLGSGGFGMVLPCDEVEMKVTLEGGPFHLRRSHVHPGALPRARVVELCSVDGLNGL